MSFRCDDCGETYGNIFDVVDQGFWSHNEGCCWDAFRFFKDHVNDKNKNGNTPLRVIAGKWGMYVESLKDVILEVMKMLIEYGADPYLECKGGSAYKRAVSKGYVELINLFDESTLLEIKEPCDY